MNSINLESNDSDTKSNLEMDEFLKQEEEETKKKREDDDDFLLSSSAEINDTDISENNSSSRFSSSKLTLELSTNYPTLKAIRKSGNAHYKLKSRSVDFNMMKEDEMDEVDEGTSNIIN
jgi:hypothetical protein